MMKKRRELLVNIVLIINVILILGIVVYGMSRREKAQEAVSGSVFSETDEDVYYLGERELAEFSDVIIEQFHKESELVVRSVETSVSVDLKQTGLFDIDLLNKTQTVIYKGTGRFYVDLSMLGEHSIRMDNADSKIIIEIPHTELAEIEIDPDKFTFEETEKGLLAFGELKFTAKEYNSLETECKKRIRQAVDIAENYRAADERAIEEMTKIYDPIVKAVDDTYRVEIVFISY